MVQVGVFDRNRELGRGMWRHTGTRTAYTCVVKKKKEEDASRGRPLYLDGASERVCTHVTGEGLYGFSVCSCGTKPQTGSLDVGKL